MKHDMTKQSSINIIFLIGLIISALYIAGCGAKANPANANSNANAAPTIVDTTTAQAIVQNMPTYFEATGNLAGDAQTDVAPTVGGKIVAVNFDIGSYVQKGSVLVQLDSRDAQIKLEQAQAQVAQAQSNVIQAQSNVQQAETNVQQVRAQLGLPSGTTFDVNQVAEVRTAKAALDFAEKEFARNERLLESGDVARTIYDQKKMARDQALAQYQSAINTANQRFEAIKTAQAQVATAQAAVKTAQAAQNSAQTQVDAARKAVSDATVYAPISGYVSDKTADVGEFVSTNQKVATIVRTSVLRLKIDVPEQNIGQVKIGQGISLQTSAYPDRNFAGKVVRIAPSVNATSRTLTVEAEVDNGDGLLKPGQFATVRITQPTPKPTVMIPVSAVKTEGDTNKVFVIKNGRAEERIVKTGMLENDKIEIQNGVQEGEMVATSNVDKLYDGVQVRQ
ncbi:MAG: efflux RND transporter periplasmic adaptor subunit [Pyrinomonadaceae bacterium]